MTKEEFDVAFWDRKLTVLHHTNQEWRDICEYVQAVDPIIRVPNYHEHDCQRFPYSGIENGCVTAYQTRSDSISYQEFMIITSGAEEVDCPVDFAEVL